MSPNHGQNGAPSTSYLLRSFTDCRELLLYLGEVGRHICNTASPAPLHDESIFALNTRDSSNPTVTLLSSNIAIDIKQNANVAHATCQSTDSAVIQLNDAVEWSASPAHEDAGKHMM